MKMKDGGGGSRHRWVTVRKSTRRRFKGRRMKGICEKGREKWEKAKEKK